MPERLLNATEWIWKFLFWITAILVPMHGVMGAMVFLIIVDFVTGVYAAYKRNEGVKASKLVNTVSKFFFYILVILCGYAFETFIVPEIPMNKIISGFIALTELKSIFENFNKIYGIDLWKVVRSWVSNNNSHSILKKQSDEKE